MIRTILGRALLLAADALGALPSPERWEAELDALRQQIGDLDAAIADRVDTAGEAREDFIRDVGRALGAHLSPFAGAVKSVADLVSEHERLNATNAELRRDLANLTARLDAARDGLITAQSCLDRLGEARVVDALLAVERGLARSAPSLSDIATPKPAAEVVREAVAEARVSGLAAPDPIDKAAALRKAGWRHYEGRGWALGAYGLGYLDTDDAHRAMVEDREREKAATPRDPLADPRPEDAATLPSKEDMAAELRAAGWYVLREAHPAGTAHPERWTNATGKAPRAALADAYAAMLADRAKAESAAPASPPRDTLAQPEPGDLFVDRDGDAWFCIGDR